MDLDADAIRKAMQEASVAGVDEEGLAAVQVALQELQAPGSIGTLADRQKAAVKMEVVARDGTEAEIQEAILEAIDVGLEDGFVVAETALAKRRAERHAVMDALVAAMEVVVVSAEQDGLNGPGCCAPEQLEALADALVEARSVAVPGEEELLNCASRLLEFELKRSEAVRSLNVRLRQHAQQMEKIVDDFHRSLGKMPGEGISRSDRAVGKLEQALDASSPSNPQWTRQSFLRRGSRRTRAETPSRPEGTAAVAEEAPALHGADRLRAEKDLRPDLKVSAETLRRLSGQEDAAGRVFGAPRPKQMPREAPTSQLLGVSAPLPAKAAGGTPASASSAATSQVPLVAAAASAPQTPRTATPVASPRLSAAQTRQGEVAGYPAASMSSASTVGSQQTLPKPPSLTLGSPAATPVSVQREPSISTSSAPSPRTAPASSSASPAKAAGLAIGSRGGGVPIGGGVRVGGGTPKQAASAASPF